MTLDQIAEAFDPQRDAGFGIALGPVPGTETVLSGIDLDDSYDDPRITPAAQRVVEASCGAYTEISPSSRGIKIFGVGDIGTAKAPQVEIYSGGRFFAVTGRRIAGDRLADLKAAAALAREILSGQDVGLRDRPISEGGRNNAVFQYACLLRGRGVPDAEAAARLREFNIRRCSPPLEEREVQDILERVSRYPAAFPLTDLGNCQRLVARFGVNMRYIPEFKRFITFDGRRWHLDRDGEPMRMAKDTARSIYEEARDASDTGRQQALSRWAVQSQSAGRLQAAVDLAKTEPSIPIKPSALDSDPMLLGVSNGTIDLRTGQLRKPDRDDLITRATEVAYDPHAAAPRWNAFLREIMCGDLELVDYLQRAVGYTLTGDTSEQVLFLLFGSGANGKSTFLNFLRKILGGYAMTADVRTLMAHSQQGPRNDLAAMRGARLVVSSEVEDGSRFAEVLVKLATGGDMISARFLYGEFFEYEPNFKLWIAANHKPVIRGDDYAIWRRIRLIPFALTLSPDKIDRTLDATLTLELPGILRWAVEGCLAWQRHGLDTPVSVQQATVEYRSEMDHLGQFLEDRCEVSAGRTVGATELFDAYRIWAHRQGLEHPWTQTKFATRLRERLPSVTPMRTMHGRGYRGIGLRSTSSTQDIEDQATLDDSRRTRGHR